MFTKKGCTAGVSKVHRVGKMKAGLDIRGNSGSSGPVGTDNLKGEQCLRKRGSLLGWEHFLIEIFGLNHIPVRLFCLPHDYCP